MSPSSAMSSSQEINHEEEEEEAYEQHYHQQCQSLLVVPLKDPIPSSSPLMLDSNSNIGRKSAKCSSSYTEEQHQQVELSVASRTISSASEVANVTEGFSRQEHQHQ